MMLLDKCHWQEGKHTWLAEPLPCQRESTGNETYWGPLGSGEGKVKTSFTWMFFNCSACISKVLDTKKSKTPYNTNTNKIQSCPKTTGGNGNRKWSFLFKVNVRSFGNTSCCSWEQEQRCRQVDPLFLWGFCKDVVGVCLPRDDVHGGKCVGSLSHTGTT